MNKTSNRGDKFDPVWIKDIYVVKRDERQEKLILAKFVSRITNLCYDLNMDYVDPTEITNKVVDGIYDGVSTVDLDNLASEVAASLTTRHPDYALLGGRIAVSCLHRQTKGVFSQVMKDLYSCHHPKSGSHTPMISKETLDIVIENADLLDSCIDYERDYNYNYFAFKTLERSYLLKINGKIVERPQEMLLRASIGIHGRDMTSVIETYQMMSEGWFTHSSATLFNAGSNRPQLSSCFLLTMMEDSIEGIFKTLEKCALISKSAASIGLNIHCVRACGSPINGINGVTDGLIPMLRVFNYTARYVTQGGNKRPGAFAVFLEPWHADIREFLDLKKNTGGSEEQRARDLFYGLWIPDLFMKRVKSDQVWSLMCPYECPGLEDAFGQDFEELYCNYEKQGRFRKQIQAREIWKAIVSSQIETGTPYMMYKDACNKKSNQQNLGTIKGTNLCTEVIEYSSSEEVACCNVASIALPRFVDKDNCNFDFQMLRKISQIVTKNLNKIIDVNQYPVPEAERSNKRHRPIAIGVQGLADVFQMMRYPFTSPQARLLNKNIFETIYYGALEASCELAEKDGPYESYQGSPVSKGLLQYDLWGVVPTELWDWTCLKSKIARHGLRNSLLTAIMPTSCTAQILGNNESIEPYTSNVYSRRVLSGDFQVLNPHLVRDLVNLGLWNNNTKNQLIANEGSVQTLPNIPQKIKEIYKTVWEISQKDIIDMAADRGAFIDHSQSLNLHLAEPSYGKCTSMHFHAWETGLKTGMYYLRSRPAVDAVKFTVDKLILKETTTGEFPSNKNETHSENFNDQRIHQLKVNEEFKNNSTSEEEEHCVMCSG